MAYGNINDIPFQQRDASSASQHIIKQWTIVHNGDVIVCTASTSRPVLAGQITIGDIPSA